MEVGADSGVMWTSEPAYVRSGPGTGFAVVATLPGGEQVAVTEIIVDGRWQQVRLGEQIGFIPVNFLTDIAPASESPSPEPSAEPSVDETAISTSPCEAGSTIEAALTDNAVQVLRAICNEFPNVSGFSGYRTDGDSSHRAGRAIDVHITGEAGWEVAYWLRANSSNLGIAEILYAQRIWSADRDAEGWREMEDRGSDTANYYDHVHVTVA